MMNETFEIPRNVVTILMWSIGVGTSAYAAAWLSEWVKGKDARSIKLGIVAKCVISLMMIGAAGFGNELSKEREKEDSPPVRTFIDELREQQQEKLAALPEDWRALFFLIKKKSDEGVCLAYIDDFLKTKNEPELTDDNYVFMTYAMGGDGREQLREKFAPYWKRDLQAALADALQNGVKQ